MELMLRGWSTDLSPSLGHSMEVFNHLVALDVERSGY
jgi:hypothetical protein